MTNLILIFFGFLFSFNLLAGDSRFLLSVKSTPYNCKEVSPPLVSEVEDYILGRHDSNNRCLDDSSLFCIEKLAFFSANMQQLPFSGEHSIACEQMIDATSCKETLFSYLGQDAEFIKIISYEYNYGKLEAERSITLSKKDVLNRQRKFIHLISNGCDFLEIEFQVKNR